jgi:Flp pilus assembly pilin Flp
VAVEYSVIVGVLAIAIVSGGGGAGGALSFKLSQVANTMMPSVTTAMRPAPKVMPGAAYNPGKQ